MLGTSSLTKVTHNYMTTNATFTVDALSTESVVETFTVNKQTFIATLKAGIAAAQLLDQFKRLVFYRSEFDREKVNHYADELRHAAEYVSRATDWVMEGPREALDVDTRIMHGVIGAATESGELLEVMLKQLEEGTIDTVNLKEEIGDVQWYMHILANAAGTDIDQCLAAVVQKLKDKKRGRYADGVYTDDSAVNRDTDAEREILEQQL